MSIKHISLNLTYSDFTLEIRITEIISHNNNGDKTTKQTKTDDESRNRMLKPNNKKFHQNMLGTSLSIACPKTPRVFSETLEFLEKNAWMSLCRSPSVSFWNYLTSDPNFSCPARCRSKGTDEKRQKQIKKSDLRSGNFWKVYWCV